MASPPFSHPHSSAPFYFMSKAPTHPWLALLASPPAHLFFRIAEFKNSFVECVGKYFCFSLTLLLFIIVFIGCFFAL